MELDIAMKKFLFAFLALIALAGAPLLLKVNPALGQCNGVFPPNTLCGNLGANPAPPAAFSATTSVVGPGSSTVGDLAIWGNTTGNQLKDVASSPWLAVDPRLYFSISCTGGTDISANIATMIASGFTKILVPAGCSYQPPTASGNEVVPAGVAIFGDSTSLYSGNLTAANVSIVKTTSRAVSTDLLQLGAGAAMFNVVVISYSCDNLDSVLVQKVCPVGTIGAVNNGDGTQNAVAYPFESTVWTGNSVTAPNGTRTQILGTLAATSAGGTQIGFASLPITVGTSQLVTDVTSPASIPGSTFVSSITSGGATVNLTKSTSATAGDTIKFSVGNFNDAPFLNIEQQSTGDGIFCATNYNAVQNPGGVGGSGGGTCLNMQANSQPGGDVIVQLSDGPNFPTTQHVGIKCREYQTVFNSNGCIFLERTNGSTIPLLNLNDDGPTTWGGGANQQMLTMGVNFWTAGPVMQIFQNITASNGDFFFISAGNGGGTFTGNFEKYQNNNVIEYAVTSTGTVSAVTLSSTSAFVNGTATALAMSSATYNGNTTSVNNYGAQGLAGVSCAAGTVSTATLTITKGIVTHC